jgi:outer membrane protein OmpA-like peptidoglycan-associated protein
MGRYQALLHLYQAQNAVGIAQVEKADLYAPDAFAAARRALNEAQHLIATKANDKLVVQYAREAEEHAEDARLIAERRNREDQLAAVERAGHALSAAPTETRLPNQADREVREPEIHTQLLQRIDGSLPAQDVSQSIVITLPDDSFDGTRLSAGVAEKLSPIATMLASHPSVRVTIQAYTDAGASELQSWERAQAVRNRLVEFGVGANQVAFRGMSVQANRRVEIIISGAQ